jgi:carboxypeptidase Q
MKIISVVRSALFFIFISVSTLSAQEPVYWDVVDQIMEESFKNNEIMKNASWLTDVYGPRNAKSPGYIAAAHWVKNSLEEYGLSSARLEPYEFGVGYVNEYISVHMTAPRYMPVVAYPATWSAGTDGVVKGPVVYMNFDEITSEADLEQYRGKLRNAVVFTRPKQEITHRFSPLEERFTDERLNEMSRIPIGPRIAEERRDRRSEENKLSRQQIIDFVFGEGCVAIVRTDGQSDYGSVRVENSRYTMETKPWEKGAPPNPTELVMAAEHYNRIMRILEKDISVEMLIELRVSFTRDDPYDYNVIAEIPGTDLAHEIVILGGHLQANPAGTGAIDDAAGVVIAMEAVRTLIAIGAQPRRTVRIGLWGGHEMGTLGNRSHVRKNFADPETKEYKKDYDNLSAYYNVDIGTGGIRGVSIMGNEVLRSIFSEWIKPLKNLGMTHLYTSVMSHEAYREVGLPSFYFDQDRREIDDMNAHSNMDTYERLVREGLMQAAVVLASFVYHTAMRDEKLPRSAPLPW